VQAFYAILLQKTFLTYADAPSGTDVIALDAVQASELLDGYSIALGDTSECISRPDFVVFGSLGVGASVAHGHGSPLVQILLGIEVVDAVLTFDEGGGHVVGQAQGIYPAVARNQVLLVLGVQAAELFDVDVADTCHLLQVQVLVDMDGVGNGRQLRFHRTDAVFAIVGHDIVGCNEARHIAAGFFREERVEFPIVGSTTGTADGFVHVAGTAILGCQYQVPVLIDGIQVLEVTHGCPSGLLRVETFFHQAVGFQTVAFAGAEHELPQAGCALA